MGFDSKVKILRGMHDIVPPDIEVWQRLEAHARLIFSNYGYQEIRTPIVEDTQLFTRSIGEETDIVEKEMYTFLDRNEKSLTLRPEGTASVVRAVIESGLVGSGDPAGAVLKFFYMGPMFRYERPQRGRQRQFFQMGVETFNDSGPGVDAEVLAMGWHWLNSLHVSQYVNLEINSLGSRENKHAFGLKLAQFFVSKANELCGDCQKRLHKNPLRLLDCKNEKCQSLRADAPTLANFLDDSSKEHFEKTKAYLETLEIPFKVNSNLVRGLDYYTGTTFEFITRELGSQGAVLAGGRYDGLMAELGGPNWSGIGFAAGCERLVELMKLNAPSPERSKKRIAMVVLGEKALAPGLLLADGLRHHGFEVHADWRNKSLKSQMRQADRSLSEFVLILGDDELAQGNVLLKRLSSGEQKPLALQPDPAGVKQFASTFANQLGEASK